MCFLGLCNAGQTIYNLIFIIQKQYFLKDNESHPKSYHTHSFVSVSNTEGIFLEAHWACWSVNQVDNVHSSSCLPIPMPQCHPSCSTPSSESHLPSLLPFPWMGGAVHSSSRHTQLSSPRGPSQPHPSPSTPSSFLLVSSQYLKHIPSETPNSPMSIPGRDSEATQTATILLSSREVNRWLTQQNLFT